MTPRARGKTSPMSARDVGARADAARRFREIALVAEGDPSMTQQAAANAVLAAIAACDAVCGRELGERFRGQGHAQAAAMLARVRGAEPAVRAFRTLIAQKDSSAYSSDVLGDATLRSLMRALDQLMQFMDEVLAR